MLVLSFSGIDGAGKSTQIENLRRHLAAADLRVTRFRFWEDVAAFRRFREFMSHALLKGDPGVGAPGKPVNRRDKNVQSWQLTMVRLVLAFLDALCLGWMVTRARVQRADVVVFDRYIYDELVNLPLENTAARAYVSVLLSLCPRPTVAYLLDADPELARLRKPEYPVEFLHKSRARYWTLTRLIGRVVVIQPLALAQTENVVLQALQHELPYLAADGLLSVDVSADS
jgi:thymidylate kinase